MSTLGNFTKSNLESTAADRISAIIANFNELEELRRRCLVELAAGTLDAPEFYPAGDTGKANILGALDDMHAVYAAMSGTTLPTLNYRRYVDFLVGI